MSAALCLPLKTLNSWFITNSQLTTTANAGHMTHPGAPPPPSPGPMNGRAALLARASWARRQQACIAVCAEVCVSVCVLLSLPPVTRCLWWDVVSTHPTKTVLCCLCQTSASRIFFLFPFFPPGQMSSLLSVILAAWAACGGLTGGFLCVACDTDKRLRRVHVSRMLPGEEQERSRRRRRRRRGGFSVIFCRLCVTLSPLGFSRTWRRRAAGGFMGLFLAVEWQTLREDEQWLWSFSSFLWMLLFCLKKNNVLHAFKLYVSES